MLPEAVKLFFWSCDFETSPLDHNLNVHFHHLAKRATAVALLES
jgi:hypothetical protein